MINRSNSRLVFLSFLCLFILGISCTSNSFNKVGSSYSPQGSKKSLVVEDVHREPSSVGSCANTMKYILVKRSRSKSMSQLIKEGNLEGIKKMFWSAHNEERQSEKLPYTRFYRKLRRLNKSHHVPALFQTQNKVVGDVDTFSTILKVADDDLDFGSHEREAIEDVLSWVEHVQNYKQRFDRVIDHGFEVRSTLERLRDRIKNDRRFKKDNFPKDVSVPYVTKEGEIAESEIYFETVDDLKQFIEEKEKEVVLTFSQNVIDEVFKKSRIYDVMIDQAVYFRRLELISERLNSIPRAKLSEDQQALREILAEVMSTPANQPRLDAVKFVRRKERVAEFWATLRFWKSKRVEKQAKYTIPAKVLEQAKAVSPYGVMMRSMALFTLVTTPVTIIYNDNPWVQYVTSSIGNRFNDFVVYTLGMPSSALSDCYKTERSWSIEEASTMNNFVESHLSRYTAYQRIDPSYDPDQDPEYIKKKVQLQSMCLKMRMEYKSADRHLANKELLDEHGYRFAAHMVLIDLVADEFKDEQLGDLLYDYFEEGEIFENENIASQKLELIRNRTSDQFVLRIKQYQEDMSALTPRVRGGDLPIYYPSSDEFFDSIDQYLDEGE
ncbi:MAG: hypothetical protein CME63_17655 [Halobacteriovoraceae bacterium]|nr:hypothetical protein [Halobacteriovoraceae bacterium]MBC99575.1 hypothetical protein [Halobacteriovoraceae bacterium]